MSTSPALLRNFTTLPDNPVLFLNLLRDTTGDTVGDYAEVVNQVWTVMHTKRKVADAKDPKNLVTLQTFKDIYTEFQRLSLQYSSCDYQMAYVFSQQFPLALRAAEC